jgi:tricarballylate dehydrogenase
MQSCDVLIVGKGNAALCAALAARDGGATVTVLEAASVEDAGDNSAFAGGVMRFAFDGVEDLKRIYAREFGNKSVGDQFQNHSYIFGC